MIETQVWKGWRALVTGASSGIGETLARRLAAGGVNLVLTARRADRLEQLATELRAAHGVEVAVIPADLGAADGPTQLLAAVAAQGLQIDMLVNNAGLAATGPFAQTAQDRELLMLQVNVVAVAQLAHQLVPAMVERGRGHVVFVGSIAAYMSIPLMGGYAGTKAYIKRFSEALGHELKGTGVGVTAIHPGGTITEFSDQAGITLTGFEAKLMMSADAVARIGLAAAAKGRLSVITGWMNWAMVRAFALLPRWLSLRIGYALYAKLTGHP